MPIARSNLRTYWRRFSGRDRARAAVLAWLVLLCVAATYYGHFILRTDIVYTHLFYIPIVVAGFWWGRRAVWVALFLGGWLVACRSLSQLSIADISAFLRCGMFIVVAVVVGELREQTLKTERTLRETRDYLDKLIRYSSAPVIVWDRQGKITLFNTAFEHLTGYAADEMLDRSFEVLFPDESREEALRETSRTLEDEYWEAVEIPIHCADGRVAICLWSSANIYAPDEKTPVATIAQGQDITLRKQAEEALHLQVGDLEAHGRITESMLEQRMRQLAAHERIVNAMLRSVDLEERLEIALREIMNLTGAEKGAISLVEGDRLVVRKQSGFSETFVAWAGDVDVGGIPSCEEIIVGWNDTPDPSSGLEAGLKKERMKSWVTIPLRSEQGLVGHFVLASDRPLAFPREQTDMLSALASCLTLMLEQAKLYRTAQERLARLTTLREIDQAISANLSLEGIIEVVLRKVSPHVRVDAVGISLVDWERKATLLARLHLPGDVDVAGRAFGLSNGLLAQLGIEKAPVIIYDVKSDPRVQDQQDVARKYNLSSYVGMPLVVQDETIGVLHLFTVEPRRFSQEDLDFFRTMAGQAAVSVQNARLYEETKRWAANMEILAGATADFSRVTQEKEVAKQILAAACEVAGAEMGALLWHDKDANTLELAHAIGVLEERVNRVKETHRVPVGPGARLPGVVGFTGKAIYVPDVSKEPGWEMEFLRTGSAYIVPQIHHEQLFGVCVFLSREVNGFSAEGRALVDTFMAYVSSALQNVRLFRETQRAYEELQMTQRELVQAQKMEAIGQLAGGVAHDFNNILTAIQGYAELALMSVQEDDPLYRDINEVRRASARAANLTRQLLLFSRRQPMTMTPLDLNSLIRDLTRMLDRLIGEDVSLTADLEPGLWTVEGDAGTIEQVIMNLVVNARDAMPEGGAIRIKSANVHVGEEYCQVCRDARPGEFVCLSATDTGMGIDPAIIDRIFEPFFTTKGPGKGTGMGLSVVYGIVKEHRGWVDVESSLGNGSTFRVYLPAVPMGAVEEPEASVPSQILRGKGERILVVEDEEPVRELAARGLSDNGYVVYCAGTVQEALDTFRKEGEDLDLIFSDLVLPNGDGFSLAKRLLELKPGISLLFTSGYGGEKADWQAIQEGGYSYLQKPYSVSDLLEAVRRVLGST